MDAQIPDRIYFEEQWFELYSNPLEQYWARTGKRPEFCTVHACNRGYVATWEIKDYFLFLRDIAGHVMRHNFFLRKRKVPFTVKHLFPRAGQRLVKAQWFSGKLRIPRGKMIRYENEDYNSRFEKEQIITVEAGQVQKIVTIDYTRKELVVNAEIHLRSKTDNMN